MFGVVRGTFAVGGSDSSCYALMADAFASGEAQPASPLALEAPWPDAPRTFAPAGFLPSGVVAGAASPICAPGFSLLLAPFRLAGGRDAIFLVTPLAGALLVWLAFVFGRQLASPAAGAAAAVLVATIPVALFQVSQPMNDIAVTALWMGILVAASSAEPSRPWLLGTLCGLAVLVRPNLAPAAVVVFIWLLVITRRIRGAPAEMVWRAALGCSLAALPWAIVLLWLNTALYGHPLRTGYGNAGDLFSAGHVVANLQSYGRALVETQLGIPLLGVLAVAATRGWSRGLVWLTLGIGASVAAVYLLYRPYPEWWYLRFLLPALAPMTVLAAVVGARAAEAIRPPALRAVMATAVVAAIAAFHLDAARDRQVFDLYRLEARFHRASEIVRERLPPNAVFVTVWQSGSVRYHAGRPSVLWDAMPASSLDAAVRWLSSRGLEPYLLLERWEEPIFRERFTGSSAYGALDWPPRYDIDRQVRIFRVADRAAYLHGGHVPVEYILR